MRRILTGCLAALLLAGAMGCHWGQNTQPAPGGTPTAPVVREDPAAGAVPTESAPPEEGPRVSRYEDGPYVSSMINGETGETAFADPSDEEAGFFFYADKSGSVWAGLRAGTTPNVETGWKTLSAGGAEALQINASLCGVAVEPSRSGGFELSWVGVEDAGDIAVETTLADGLLTLTCTGQFTKTCYVNTSPDARVNTVRLGVPQGVLRKIGLDCGAGNILVADLAVPVEGVETSGVIRVTGETVSAAVDLECGNGTVAVKGGTVTGAVDLTAANGTALLDAGTASGPVTLTAHNGSVKARADRLDNAALSAVNGSVKAEVGTVGEKVSAQVRNGSLEFTLTREPEDLTFRLSGGWRSKHGDGRLPMGWGDGYTVGDGGPVLELSSASNGFLELSVGEKSS